MNKKIQKTIENAKNIKSNLSEIIKEKNEKTKTGIIGNLRKVYHEVYFEDVSGIDTMDKLDVNSIKENNNIQTKKVNDNLDNNNLDMDINKEDNVFRNNIYQDELTEEELEILKNINKQIDDKFKIKDDKIKIVAELDKKEEKTEKEIKETKQKPKNGKNVNKLKEVNSNKSTSSSKPKKIVNNILDIDKMDIKELDLNFSKRVNKNNKIQSILDIEIDTEEIDDIGKILGEDKKNNNSNNQ